MKSFPGVGVLLFASALPLTGLAQETAPATSAPKPAPVTGAGIFRGTFPVQPRTVTATLNLPFSADGITTTMHQLANGTRIEQRTNTKLFRDSAGRVRREQAVIGLTAEQAALPVVTITDPAAAVSYTLDSRTQTAYRAPLFSYVRSGGIPVSSPTVSARYYRDPDGALRGEVRGPAPRAEGPDDAVGIIPRGIGSRIETLTTQQIAGLWSTGTRTSVRLSSGMVGNDRPLDVTSERWTSTDLNVVVLSRSNDPRVGTTEYRLTNIVRSEPPAGLFVVPSSYRIVDTMQPPPVTGR